MNEQSDNNNKEDVLVRLTLDSIQSLPNNLQEAILLVSIPRFFNLEILRILLPNNISHQSKVLNKLKNLSLVREYGKGNYLVHDAVREIVLKTWRQKRHDEFISINKKLADFYGNSIYEVGTSLLKIESIYHKIISEEDNGFIWFEKEFLQALEFGQLDYSSAILDAVESVSEELKPNHRLWIIFYKGLLQEKLNRPEKALEYYKVLESQDGWPSETRTFFISKIISIARGTPSSLSSKDSVSNDIRKEQQRNDIKLLKEQLEKYKFLSKFFIVGIITLILIAFIFILPTFLNWHWLLNHPKKIGLQLCSSLIVSGVAWIIIDADKSRKWIAFSSIVISAIIAIIQLL